MHCVYTCIAGPEHTVFVNDIDTVNEVLLKKGADFASRAKVPSSKYSSKYKWEYNLLLVYNDDDELKFKDASTLYGHWRHQG